MLLVSSCASDYDDSHLLDRLDDLEQRMQKLEAWCSQTNTNISSLQSLLTALQERDYITHVTPSHRKARPSVIPSSSHRTTPSPSIMARMVRMVLQAPQALPARPEPPTSPQLA